MKREILLGLMAGVISLHLATLTYWTFHSKV